MAYEWEREEAKDALRDDRADATCYRHYWSKTKWGAICTGCGETVGEDEL